MGGQFGGGNNRKKIYFSRPDNWLPDDPGYLLGRAGCEKSARPDL